MLKSQRTRYNLTFKIRFKHGGNTSIIFYTYESEEQLTVAKLAILRTTIYYKVVIHNVLLQASTYMDGGSGLLDFIIGFMEDISK